MRVSAALLAACLGLAACSEPEPQAPAQAPPGAEVTVSLGQPEVSQTATVFPVTLRNDGSQPVGLAVVDCAFRDAEGALLFTGQAKADALAPGASATSGISVPRELADQIAGLDCYPEARLGEAQAPRP